MNKKTKYMLITGLLGVIWGIVGWLSMMFLGGYVPQLLFYLIMFTLGLPVVISNFIVGLTICRDVSNECWQGFIPTTILTPIVGIILTFTVLLTLQKIKSKR